MCRLMLKRLNQEEIFELINEKQIFQEQILFNNYRNQKIYEEEEESFEEEEYNKNNYLKKRKNYHENYDDESEDMK